MGGGEEVAPPIDVLATDAQAGTVRIGRLASFRPLLVLPAVVLFLCLDRLGVCSHLFPIPTGVCSSELSLSKLSEVV